MNKLLFLIVIALLQWGCSNAQEYGSEVVRSVGKFSSLKLSSGVGAEFYKSKEYKVVIVVENEANAAYFSTKVKGAQLEIKKESNRKHFKHTVKIYAPNLTVISLDSGSSLSLEDAISNSNIQVEVDSGSSMSGEIHATQELQLEVDSGSSVNLIVESNLVKLEVDSGSSAKLQGKVNQLLAVADSGSSINAKKLEMESGKGDASSGSSISFPTGSEVQVNKDYSSSVSH